MRIYVTFTDGVFTPGAGQADVRVQNGVADVAPDQAAMLCSEYRGYFSTKPWPAGAVEKTEYRLPGESAGKMSVPPTEAGPVTTDEEVS
jgi:hypothetical protein